MADVSKQLVLGIEGGATKTEWMLCERTAAGLSVVQQGRLGPGNMKLLDEAALHRLFAAMPQADSVGICLAGCASEKDRAYVRSAALAVWPKAKIFTGSDRDSAFAAAFGQDDGIVVIAGTGSAVTGRKNGTWDYSGGWGHLLGDSGGGYDLSIRALRRVLYDFDLERRIHPLAHDILRTLGLNTLRELTAWAQTAHKDALARLTPIVFEHAHDPEAHAILKAGAEALSCHTLAVARRLEMPAPSVQLTGGVFGRQPLYVKLYTDALHEELPGATVALSTQPGPLGAAMLAAELFTKMAPQSAELPADGEEISAAPTEQSNPRSQNLNTKTVEELVALFVNEEHHVEEALRGASKPLAAAIDLVTATMKAGGRLFYIGAGTSGRLGVLDASEIPPTFGLPPDRVQGIIAGGASALQQSIEGAEDDPEGARCAILDRGLSANDVLCGIAASGRTPFVFAALEAARTLGARTILLTCNPARHKSPQPYDVEIDLATGPEIITGSTRLKAGTATKVALNIISSGTMIRLNRVDGNRMACLNASNAKLRHRAITIVAEALSLDKKAAEARLVQSLWDIRAALNSGR